MRIYKFGEKITSEISLCLGYFDSVHKGHRKLIEMAKEKGGELTVFTFAENIKTPTKKAGVVFTIEERIEIFESLGVCNLIVASFEDVKDIPACEFLDILGATYQICGVTCGFDYKFGQKAHGDIQLLGERFGDKFSVCDKVEFGSEKASSNLCKELIENGDMKALNELLQTRYFVSGYCEKGFQNGTKLGFPTANIKPATDKILLKEGVYIGETKIDNVMYKSMINVGKVPTFGGEEYKIETHCIGICEALYGKQITVYFERFLREARKFSSIEELKCQLQKDIKEIL